MCLQDRKFGRIAELPRQLVPFMSAGMVGTRRGTRKHSPVDCSRRTSWCSSCAACASSWASQSERPNRTQKTAVGFCSEPGTSSPAQVKLEHPLMNRKVGLLLARVPCAQDMAEALEKHLEQEGYEVLLADTSGGAVRMSGEGHPASARESTAAPTHRLPHLGTVCFAFCNASFVSSSLRCRWQIDGTDAAVRRKRSM